MGNGATLKSVLNERSSLSWRVLYLRFYCVRQPNNDLLAMIKILLVLATGHGPGDGGVATRSLSETAPAKKLKHGKLLATSKSSIDSLRILGYYPFARIPYFPRTGYKIVTLRYIWPNGHTLQSLSGQS